MYKLHEPLYERTASGSTTESYVACAGFGFQASGFGFQVSWFEFRVSGFGFRVSSFRFRVSGFGFRVSNFGVRAIGFRVSGVTWPCSPTSHGSRIFHCTTHIPRASTLQHLGRWGWWFRMESVWFISTSSSKVDNRDSKHSIQLRMLYIHNFG